MQINRTEVEQIARLAKLSLSADEIASLARDLGDILDHVRELEGAPLEGVPPTWGVSAHPAPFRDDLPGADPLSMPLADLAPRMEESFFVVPRLAALDADALGEDRIS